MSLLDLIGIQNAGFQRDVALGTALPIDRVPPQQLLEIQGRPDEAEELALTLGAELVSPVPADFIWDAEAIVRFGAGGSSVQLVADLGPAGQILHVPCSFLSVQFRGIGIGTMRVRGHVAYAAGTRGPATTRTRFAQQIAAAAVADFAIPPFAAVARIGRTPQTEPYHYDFLRQNLVSVAQGLVAAGQGEQSVRVPSDAAFLRLTNLGINQITQARAIFELGV